MFKKIKREFGYIPNEIFLQILFFLDDQTIFYKAAIVCKRLNKLTHQEALWKNLALRKVFRIYGKKFEIPYGFGKYRLCYFMLSNITLYFMKRFFKPSFYDAKILKFLDNDKMLIHVKRCDAFSGRHWRFLPLTHEFCLKQENKTMSYILSKNDSDSYNCVYGCRKKPTEEILKLFKSGRIVEKDWRDPPSYELTIPSYLSDCK
jgi:hypothetical protein